MYTVSIKNKEGLEVTKYAVNNSYEEVSVGKEPLNNIVLNDPSISSTHCVFIFNRKKITVKNTKSRNGIIINGERLKKETYNMNGTEEIKCGDFSFNFSWTESPMDSELEKKNPLATFAMILFLLAAMFIVFVLIKPEPEKIVKIGEIQIPDKKESLQSETGKTADSWRILLSKAKDAYFNDNILLAAKLFKEVMDLQPGNIEASNFLDQIKKEFVPKIEESVLRYIEERNIVSCSKAVKDLIILNPESPCIGKANGLLEGYKKFDEIRDLFKNHRFKDANGKIQNIVLVDEETLSYWKVKIKSEVSMTDEFEAGMIDYRNGDLSPAYKKLKTFASKDTLQKVLQTVALEKMRLMKMYYKFKKLEKQDPLKQSAFGVEFIYEINEKEDPYIFEQVTKRLKILEKECGTGTDFYLLLRDDTLSQLEQGRDYKIIKETNFALKNYKNAYNGLRILAYFSKDEKFIKLEKEVFNEIMEYHNILKQQAEKMKNLNEFDGAENLEKLIDKFEVHAQKEPLKLDDLLGSNYGGDEAEILSKIMEAPYKAKENLPGEEPMEAVKNSDEISLN